MLRVRSHILHIPAYRIQLSSLLMHNMRHISEQFIQLSNALLDVSDFRLSLDNQRFLEIDFVL